MADVNAEIGVNIDTSSALAQLKSLQREIARFHSSVAKSSEAAALAQRDLQRNFLNGVNAIRGFSAELRTVRTTAENFTDSLEKNKFSMREYFRYSAASTRTFGRFFRSELDTVNKVAIENVKRLQTQYIKMGRDASGAMRAIAVMPTQLDMTNLTTKTQLAAQKQALFNELVKQGSTNLLNFGKNTQWAGRQLMVGFTIPLIGLGSVATKTFMDMETAAIKFRKVYGDLFTPTDETQFALESIQALGQEFTKYGISVANTVSLAADAAAAGFQGQDLQAQVAQATRLQVLGQIDQQKALETTISLQNAFKISSNDLADSINFLNAVENQTVVSLDDITTAIPKAAPIVKELGGDVKDLAFFMAAMKEGGINASEGANALKSGLASLINPSNKARGMLNDMGIDIDRIVESNVGNLKATVIEFAQALDGLSGLQRQRAIEQLFGKFQQARLSALFDNVIKEGNQAARVLDLAGASVEDLASLAEKELGITANSSMNKFRKAVEDLRYSLVPVGQAFLEVLTPLLDKLNTFLDWFNGLSDGTKKVITKIVLYLGGLAPVLLMTIGLMANFVANGIKGLMLLRNGFLRLTGQSKVLGEQTNYLSVEQQNAVAAAASLEQSHMKLQQAFTGEAGAVRQLIAEYQRMIAAQNSAATRFPGMMAPGFKTKKFSKGRPYRVGGSGNQDTEPAMLTPGETVIPADMSKQYAPLINGMIAGNIPGYQVGKQISNAAGLVFAHGVAPREIGKEIAQALISVAPGLQQKAFSQATTMKGLTNFGFIAPEALNKGKMTGNQSSAFFAKNTEMATSRILKSIYDLVPGSVNDPSVRKDVLLFGENISRELATAGSRAVSEKDFYVHVENALSNTMKQATSQAFRKAIPMMQSQITTVAAYGGELNRGERGQRYALSKATQTQAFGYGSAMTSYKSGTLTKQVEKFGYTTGQAAVQSVAVGAATASPSRKTIQIGEDIARGLQVGMINQLDETKLAAQQLSAAATTLINPRTGRPFTQQELAGLTRVTGPQVNALAQGAGGGGRSPVFLGMPSFPERPAEGTQRRFGRIRGAVSGVSDRVKGAGGGFGISAILFGLSMLPGKLGQLAQSIMPVVFGLQALGMITKIIGGWPTLFLAVGAGLYMLNKNAIKAAETLIDSSKKEAEARYGSAKAIEEYAEFTGRSLPSAREFSRNNRQLISASGEAVKRFAEFYGQKDNRSTAVLNQAAMKSPKAGIRAAAVDVAQRAAIFGLGPTDIAANIKAAADLIGADQVKLKMAVQSILSPDGKDITKEPLTIKARMEFLQKDAANKVKTIEESITNISKISIPKSATNFLTGSLGVQGQTSYQTLKRSAGLQSSINQSYSGGIGGNIAGAAKQTGRFLSGFYDQAGLVSFDAMGQFKKLQDTIQSASTQLSIAFTQENESLALLNAQYVDGTITKEEYDAQMEVSSANFAKLGDSSKNLVSQLDKIDKSGELSAAALKDLGTQAFSTLKKSNPELFKKITKSLQDLDSAAQVDIMMGYAQGSLTILDVARLPELLDKIDGKTVQAAIKILAESGVGAGMLEGDIRKRLLTIDKEIASFAGKMVGPDAARVVAGLREEKRQLEIELKKINDSKKVIKTGALDTDGKNTKNQAGGVGKLTDAYDKEIDALRRKRDALKDVNDEMDRQAEYQMRQMDLITQASKAKISGNFMEAAMLRQQSMFEGGKFTRESNIVQLDRLINLVEERKAIYQDTKKFTSADKTLLSNLRAGNYESISPLPKTPTVGFGAGALGFSGSTTSIGGSMYTITMNITGNNPNEIADKVISKIKLIENKNNKSNKVKK